MDYPQTLTLAKVPSMLGQQFPGVVLANITGFKPREFFELENQSEAQNVEVKF